MRIHRIPGISRVVITTSLDDYSGDHPPSSVKLDEQPTGIRLNSDGTPILYYPVPLCPRCFSRNVSRNGTYMREVQGHSVRIQKYICKECSYSFEARPPGYGYEKHIPEDLKDKTTKARVLRTSVPDMPDLHDRESSGYFSYDEQYVGIDGERKYRFLLRDTVTGKFHESILEEPGEDATTAFILDALKRFSIGSVITITTDGYHYKNAFRNVSRKLHVNVKRQRLSTKNHV